MRISTITAAFTSDIKKVWDVVTDNTDVSWRSDLSQIEILEDGNAFIEYTKDGFSTNFKITVKKPYERYEFDIENKNMTGHWIGVFSRTNDGGTKIDFTEEIHIRNPIMRVLSYLFMNLKKIQQIYVNDLKKKLGE